MMNQRLWLALFVPLLLFWNRGLSQPGNHNFGRIWAQGGSLIFYTTFDSGKAPDNKIAFQWPPTPIPYLSGGHSGICDSAGQVLLVSDGYSLYGRNMQYIDGGQELVPHRIYNQRGISDFPQSSIILPFGNGKYRLITPTVSDNYYIFNWDVPGQGAIFDQMLYDEIDMYANGGAGKVTKRAVTMLEDVRLSKTQMMACRHGDGKSWCCLNKHLIRIWFTHFC